MTVLNKIENYLNEAKAQDLLKKYIEKFDAEHGWEPHKYIELSDVARRPEFRGIHFKDLQSAAKALSKKKFVNFDGFSKLTGVYAE